MHEPLGSSLLTEGRAPEMPLRILSIERQRSVGEAYGHRLSEEEDFAFLGVLSDHGVLEEALARLRPDICLVDLLLGDGSAGVHVLQRIDACRPSILRLVILDSQPSGTALLAAALREEPDGFFARDEPLDELVKAVRLVSEGQYRTSTDLSLMGNTAESITSMFSKGEFRVVCALARHGNKAETAKATYYSAETINTYVRRVRKHVADFEGRASIRLPDLVAWARAHGFHLVDQEL